MRLFSYHILYFSDSIFISHKFKLPHLHFSSMWAYANQFLVKRPCILFCLFCRFLSFTETWKSLICMYVMHNVHLSHFISISQKFKLPCLQLSWMNELNYAKNDETFKKGSFLSSTTYAFWYINEVLYAKPYRICFTINFSLYRLEPIKIYIIIYLCNPMS